MIAIRLIRVFKQWLRIPHFTIYTLCFPTSYYYFPYTLTIEDDLASMWNTLSLIENESITLQIDPNILSVPDHSVIGKVAMRKNVSLFDIDKGMKIIWNATQDLETTMVGDNLYLFSLKNERVLDHVINNQPWNFRGALMILDRTRGDVHPIEVVLQKVPFWSKSMDSNWEQ